MPRQRLTRQQIVEGLNLLGHLAAEESLVLEVCIFGGAAMMLAYNARETTFDVDALVRPREVGERLVLRVAHQIGLPDDWLNDGVAKFTSIVGTYAPLKVQELENKAARHLRITRASAAYLLAMKCLAFRPRLGPRTGDLEDLEFLIRKMGLRTVEAIEEVLDRFYPTEAFTPERHAVVVEMLRRIAQDKS
jgi:hypothetical protein